MPNKTKQMKGKELTFHEKLIDIQSTLDAPKKQFNKFGNYNYRSCEDILEALKPLLQKHKLTLLIRDEITPICDRFYVKATVTLTDGKEKIEASAYAREEAAKKGMDGSQITGASSSYARKYALNGLFLIDDSKDSDATNKGEQEAPKEEPKKELMTSAQVQKIKDILGDKLQKFILVKGKPELLTKKQAGFVIGELAKRQEEAKADPGRDDEGFAQSQDKAVPA